MLASRWLGGRVSCSVGRVGLQEPLGKAFHVETKDGAADVPRSLPGWHGHGRAAEQLFLRVLPSMEGLHAVLMRTWWHSRGA